MEIQDVVIVGAGAAGCFAGALLGQINPFLRISILEKTRQPLAKVKISGGGRCNVTHNCFEVADLIQSYPRGKEFLQGPFHRFQPQDMILWLKDLGVELKTESDGRMFPITNSSQTIINCFLDLLKKQKAQLCLENEIIRIVPSSIGFDLVLKDESIIQAKKVLFATGGMTRSYPILEELGHTMEKPIPSLFTFELEDEWIKKLSGSVSPSAKVSIEGSSFSFRGPLLVTHFGLSGPAVLKLSAFAAKWLFERNYKATALINWTDEATEASLREVFYRHKKSAPSKRMILTPLFSLSKNLWKALLVHISPEFEEKVWARVSKEELDLLAKSFYQMPFKIIGKSLNKEEFVTCGGVALNEIHPRTMESRKVPGLYFAGEVINIDGITGGFNFQNAWTGAWLAAQAISTALL